MWSSPYLTVEYLESWLSFGNFIDFNNHTLVFRSGIPILWILSLLLLWRISSDMCFKKVNRQYRGMALTVLSLSAIFYTLSFVIENFLWSFSSLIVSFFGAAVMASSIAKRYREEYVM